MRPRKLYGHMSWVVKIVDWLQALATHTMPLRLIILHYNMDITCRFCRVMIFTIASQTRLLVLVVHNEDFLQWKDFAQNISDFLKAMWRTVKETRE